MDKKTIKNLIRRNRVLAVLYVHLNYSKWMNMLGRKRDINEAVDRFVPGCDEKIRAKLSFQLLLDCFRFGIALKEYFYYHFEDLNDAGKHSFIGLHERTALCEQLSSPETREYTKDKYKTYQALRPFFKREIISVCSDEDRGAFNDFTSRHRRFIMKPRYGSSGGNAVELVDLKKTDPEKVFSDAKDQGSVLEEIIIQSEDMSRFNPDSVNTVRFATFRGKNGTVTPLFSFFRIGRSGSLVDNIHSGGLFASVDIDTGLVKTLAMDPSGHKFVTHPDSGMQVIGFMIPKWDELKEITVRAAEVLKDIPYLSWDLALTDNGWALVEANSKGEFCCQYVEGKGCREEIEKIFNAKDGRVLP